MAPEYRLIIETQVLQNELLLHIADLVALPESQQQRNDLAAASENMQRHQDQVKLFLARTDLPNLPHV